MKGFRERKITLKIAKTPLDFERVRHIRNECRTFMTRDKRKISLHEQAWYWLKKNFDRYTIVYLGYSECDKAIAYGVLSYDDRLQPWVTGGLRARYRGLGYGRLLFQALCYSFHEPIYLEVLADNIPAFNLYKSLGFQEISRYENGFDTVIVMREEHD